LNNIILEKQPCITETHKLLQNIDCKFVKKEPMLETAIEEITGIINIFPDIKKITITNKNHITVFLGRQVSKIESKNDKIYLHPAISWVKYAENEIKS
jgi:hypothetical protein